MLCRVVLCRAVLKLMYCMSIVIACWLLVVGCDLRPHVMFGSNQRTNKALHLLIPTLHPLLSLDHSTPAHTRTQECILANLIFSGKVRGYISHEKRILVLSKKDPFPTSVIIPK